MSCEPVKSVSPGFLSGDGNLFQNPNKGFNNS